MSDEIAIRVDHVSKNFQLPHEKITSVKSGVVNIFRNKNRRIETQHALKNISFEIKKGEFFGIVGRNGSGKSTLLKIIAGIYQPTKGKIEVSGRLVPFIELGVGFNPELTGRENVYLNGALMGFSKKEINAKYDAIVDFAELERFMDQKLKNYSSGMQVRLAFSVATVLADSDILLIDEVLAVGDANFQRKCYEYFRSLKKNKKTVIFVSHDMNAVREYCDRAVLIENSKVIKVGKSDDIATEYSRMFVNSSEDSTSRSAEVRWGVRKAYFVNAKIAKKKLTDIDSSQEFTVTLRANEDIEDIITGFYIKNSTGSTVLGTNNQIVKQNIKVLRKGEEVDLKWTVPNIFSEGRHEIGLAVESNSQIDDWWESALLFNVALERNTPYGISPLVTLDSEHRGINENVS